MSFSSELVLKFKRDTIHSLLEQCTQNQRDFFWKIYPGGEPSIPDSKLDSNIDLIHRTLESNRKAAATEASTEPAKP